MQKQITLQCIDCNKTYDYQFILRCRECNGAINPIYDLNNAQITESKVPMERYFSLLPIQDTRSITYLGEGNTPCFQTTKIGEIYGLEKLYLKDETGNVTGSTKDRMAACVISQFKELGINEFVASSTGNSSTAFAYAVQKETGMKLHLFCGKDFVHRHAHYDHPNIQLHVIDGNFVDAGKAAQKYAKENNLVYEGGFFNLARREGLKLAYLEAFDQMPEEPDVVIQAVSSGMGLYGAYRGATEYLKLGRLSKIPKFVCAQQDTCAPMVNAFKANSPQIREEDVVHNPSGLAEAILRGDPSQAYPYMYSLVKETRGTFVDVSQEILKQTRVLLKETEDIDACYAAATALAAAKKLKDQGFIQSDDVVLVNLTGGMNRPSVNNSI